MPSRGSLPSCGSKLSCGVTPQSRTRTLSALLLLVGLSLLPASDALGQAPVVVRTINSARILTTATPTQQPVAAQPGAAQVASPQSGAEANPTPDAETAESPEQQLLTKLLATSFERTPQAVLSAWSYRAPQPKSESKNGPAATVTATVANAFQSTLVLQFESPPKFKAGTKIHLTAPAIEDGEKESGETADDQAETGGRPVVASVLSIDGNNLIAKLEPLPADKKEASKRADKNTTVEQSAELDKAAAEDQPAADQSSGTTDEETDADESAEQSADASSAAVAEPIDTAESEEALTDGNAASINDDQPSSAPATKLESPNALPAEAKDQAVAPVYPTLATGARFVVVSAPSKPKTAAVDMAAMQLKIDTFQRQVMLGQWDEVDKFLKAMKPDRANQLYGHLLTSLAKTEAKLPDGVPEEMAAQLMQQMQRRGQQAPPSFIGPDDILALAAASPKPIRIVLKSDEPAEEAAPPTAAAASPATPPRVVLPPGMSLNDLPPEARAALARSGAANVTSAAGEAPQPARSDQHIQSLASLIAVAKDAGHDFAPFVATLQQGTTHFGTDDRIKTLTTADLLLKAGLVDSVEPFLPLLDQAETMTDLPALKLWSQFALAQHRNSKVATWLEKAWSINQAILKLEDAEQPDKDLALTNLIELTPQVDKELGQAWLNASFTEAPDRGVTILSNLGTKSATMATQAAMVDESKRLKLLRLQNKAVEDMLRVAPEQASEWAQSLTLLARNWLTEAETSIQYSKENSRSAFMSVDMYGNYYWVDENQYMQRYGGSRQPQPIKIGDVLEIRPSDAWKEHVSTSLLTQMDKVTATLHMRINEEDEAFPFIEKIAVEHPEIARELVHEFLRIWTTNHDPNTSKRQRNPYIYSFGFDQKADAIPLTRSKQERNLAELSSWIQRIRKMQLEDLDESRLADAFTTCHSSAEVFKLEAVKEVFGELEELKPETVAAIAEKMRANLTSQWRDIRNQEAMQTKRKAPEVQEEVLRGYDVATSIIAEALAAKPDNWELNLVQACLMFDANAYSQSVQKSSEYSTRRDQAFEQFKLAAEKYAGVVASLEEKEQSTDVFDKWFYAALGAVDLGKITDKTVPDRRQYERIRESILALPGALAESHMAKVANNMFTRMSPIKPEIKFRYLRGGFEIVGDHPRAWEASNLYDYYKDLVSEIKLQVEVDGDVEVGHNEPFGLYVNLLHTSEIEREAGGFAKYLQNQNSMPYAFNYGRPTEDYRDKFTDSVSQSLGEHFDVENVTFVSPDAMESIAAPQSGWRLTPYAYVLLKAKGSEVDRIAPLKLDMDFLDTSGYVVIPIESPALVINCSDAKGNPRPVSDLKVTQTLDERQAGEGKLIVEITASAKGLVPSLDDLLDLKREKFELVSVDDQGVLPSRFDKDTDGIQILSDRSWTVEYRAVDTATVTEFEFSDSKIAAAATKFQRYDDADLVEVGAKVDLEKAYVAEFSWRFLYWLIPAVCLGLVALAALVYMSTRPQEQVAKRFSVPEDVNPFTVLTLLQDIKRRNGISQDKAVELDQSINRIERFYFGKTENEKLDEDLAQLAQKWVGQAQQS